MPIPSVFSLLSRRHRGTAHIVAALTMLAGGVFAVAHASAWSATNAPVVVGIASFGPHPALSRTIAGFKQQLAHDGYVEGKNIRYVYSDANFTPSLIPQTLAQIVAQHPAVILTVTTPVAQAAVRNVPDPNVKLVFAQVTDPVRGGLVPDWQHGSSRITGTSSATDYDAVLKFATQLFPGAKRFGVLYDAGEINDVIAVADLKAAAQRQGLTMLATTVDSTMDVPQRARTLQRIDFFYAIGSNVVQSALPALASVTDRMHVPILSAEHELIRKGDIIAAAYAPSYESQGAHAAQLAERMLDGANSADLPTYRAVPGDYVALINRRKMNALGRAVPAALQSCRCFVN